MSDDLHYFCPQCQSMELEIKRSMLVGGRSSASCKLCEWAGVPEELLATITPASGEFWTGDKVANALLSAAAKYAAGPMVQVLELIGLVPKVEGSVEEQESAQAVREEIVKAILEAVVTAAFETAAERTAQHFARFAKDKQESVNRVFSFAEAADDRP